MTSFARKNRVDDLTVKKVIDFLQSIGIDTTSRKTELGIKFQDQDPSKLDTLDIGIAITAQQSGNILTQYPYLEEITRDM